MNLNRREFLRSSALSAAGLAAAGTWPVPAGAAAPASGRPAAGAGVALTDTNVHLGTWPFRRLRYDSTPALVEKLRRHGVRQAWAGSFEGLLAKDIAGVNARLAAECRGPGAGFLVPMGSVNPLWPDWEDDVRRCHEEHRMPGIRLHPGYHGYGLDHAEFARLLDRARERRLLVQIVLEMEDPRVHHPAIKVLPTPAAPLVALLQSRPDARVQLLGSWQWLRVPAAKPLVEMANVTHDLSGLEAVGAVGRVLEGTHWSLPGRVPLERILFGSHAPFFPVEAALLRMFESPLTRAQMQAIMETNARRVLGGA